jgi:hypothetical protein
LLFPVSRNSLVVQAGQISFVLIFVRVISLISIRRALKFIAEQLPLTEIMHTKRKKNGWWSKEMLVNQFHFCGNQGPTDSTIIELKKSYYSE